MTTLMAEDKKVTQKRIQLQRTANHPGQWIEGLAKLRLTDREIDPSVGKKAQHLGRRSRLNRKVEGSKLGGSRRRQPNGATLSDPSAELAEADDVQSTGTKAGLFWEAMEWVGCGNWVGGVIRSQRSIERGLTPTLSVNSYQ